MRTTKVWMLQWGHRKESPGKEVDVVWACDEKRGALRRKEGDGCTGEKEERKAK